MTIKLLSKLRDRKYRNLFIAGQIKTGIPFQIRALRAARGNMTQKELGERTRLPQTVVSRIENGCGSSLTIKTLQKLAEAFDVALVVRFEPIDKLADWVNSLSPEAMSPQPSAQILDEIERKTAGLVNVASSTMTISHTFKRASTPILLQSLKPESEPVQVPFDFKGNYDRSFEVIKGSELGYEMLTHGGQIGAGAFSGKPYSQRTA